MGALRWTGKRWVAWPIGVVWIAAAAWRFVLAVAEDDDGFGVAQRQHIGLLMLQAAFAVLAAVFWAAAVVSVREGDRGQSRFALVACAVMAAGFAAIFLRSGLTDWGCYEI
jgi:heme/copper-type cytochrome/quinol oxidase subunit 3